MNKKKQKEIKASPVGFTERKVEAKLELTMKHPPALKPKNKRAK